MPGGHPLAESSFGPNAEAYERGRPGWPEAALDAVAARLGLAPDSPVLDLAAGTGKLTRLLVARFGEAFHWFDPARAAAELARVVRPGGGVAVLYNRRSWGEDEEPWLREWHAGFEQHRLRPGDVDPWDTESWKVPLRERFGPLVEEELENRQRFSADELVAQYASFSSIGGLPPERRDAALAALGEVLERHGIREASLTYRTVMVTAAPASTSSG